MSMRSVSQPEPQPWWEFRGKRSAKPQYVQVRVVGVGLVDKQSLTYSHQSCVLRVDGRKVCPKSTKRSVRMGSDHA